MIATSLRKNWLEYTLISVWICNCLIAGTIAIREVWIPHMSAGGDSYTQIRSAPFDGTVMPIAYIPDWTKVTNQDKTKRFEDIQISDYLSLPTYDPTTLQRDMNNTTIGTPILSIANGVVVRTVEADTTGNKFVVIRHDNVPIGGKLVSLYSGYLHLSQITVTEGTKIAK